jgi:O-methyltransferase
MKTYIYKVIKFVPRKISHVFYLLAGSMLLKRKRNKCIYHTGDYVRLSSLELVAYEINENKLPGNVAELGVYRGDFAQHINLLFPDRKLYLFDTFEGFDRRDTVVDVKNDFSSGTQDFSNTNVDLVLKKMKYPDKCIVKQGIVSRNSKRARRRFHFCQYRCRFVRADLSRIMLFLSKIKKRRFYLYP